jgi:hypothetical protein
MTSESMRPSWNWSRERYRIRPMGTKRNFPNGIANFTKGLPHDQLGETDVVFTRTT